MHLRVCHITPSVMRHAGSQNGMMMPASVRLTIDECHPFSEVASYFPKPHAFVGQLATFAAAERIYCTDQLDLPLSSLRTASAGTISHLVTVKSIKPRENDAETARERAIVKVSKQK